MQRFLAQLALFGVGLLGLNAGLWIWSQRALFTEYRKGFSQVLEASHPAILLGDSHTRALGNVEEIDARILNLGYPSDSLGDMLIKLIYCADEDNKLRILFLQADDHILNDYRLQVNNRQLSVEYSNFASYQASYGGGVRQYVWEQYVVNYMPMLAVDRAELFQRHMHSTVRGWLHRGPSPAAPADDWSLLPVAERQRQAEARIQAHYTGEQAPQLMDTLDKIVREARAHGIQVVGVKYPLTPEYRERAEARSNGQSVAEFLGAYGVEVLDFSRLYDDHPEFFKDPDHLNLRGAQDMVRRLSVQVDRLTSARFKGGS